MVPELIEVGDVCKEEKVHHYLSVGLLVWFRGLPVWLLGLSFWLLVLPIWFLGLQMWWAAGCSCPRPPVVLQMGGWVGAEVVESVAQPEQCCLRTSLSIPCKKWTENFTNFYTVVQKASQVRSIDVHMLSEIETCVAFVG